MQNYLDLFTKSFQRLADVTIDDVDFFSAFYNAFVSDSAEAAEKFRNVDMERQREHLRKSLDHMLYFSIDRVAGDEMLKIAKAHSRSIGNIRPELYEVWLDSLLKTVRAYDPEFNDEVEIAWRVVLAPGISYMQLHYDRF